MSWTFIHIDGISIVAILKTIIAFGKIDANNPVTTNSVRTRIGTGIVVSIVAVITSFFETQLEVAVATNGRLTKTGNRILIVITIIAGFVTILTWTNQFLKYHRHTRLRRK